MSVHYDPQNNEIKTLERYANWSGQRVLELGCGAGRLTERLAALGAIIAAHDPDEARIKEARQNLPAAYKAQVSYQAGGAEQITAPDGYYDLIIYSWSL